MEDIIHFISNHCELLINCLIAIFSIVFFILRKKPIKVIDGVREDIFKWCVAAVSYVESKNIVGSSNKLNAAVQYVYENFMDKYYPTQEGNKSKFWVQYAEMSIRYIEAILSTPQKKK